MDARSQQIVGLTRGPSVLDVGFLGGLQTVTPPLDDDRWVHRHLVETFEDVWGIDLSEERVAYARSHGVENVMVGDAETFRLDRRFDSVVAGELLEHLPNPAAFLRTAREHLEPGGRIVVSTPYPFGLEFVAYAWLKFPRTCPNPEHTVWICPVTLRRLAELSGLRVVQLELLRDDRSASGFSPYQLALRASNRTFPLLPLRLSAKTIVAVLEAAT